MSLEFLVWFLGLAAGNFIFVIPLYLLVSFIVYKLTKGKSDLMVFGLTFSLLMTTMLLLQSFTIANTVSMFLETLLLIWMGNVLYYDSRREISDGGKQHPLV